MAILKGIFLFLFIILGLILQPIFWLIALFIPNDKTIYYHTIRKFKDHNINGNLKHTSFISQEDFEKLESKLLSTHETIGIIRPYETKPKIKFLGFIYGAQTPEGGEILKCKTSGNLWELSVPDNAYRGYFMGINLSEDEIKEYLK